jgi:polyhydroxybutyrate depolymerase
VLRKRQSCLCTVHEGGHSIPGPKKARPRILMGRTDGTFDTARAISQFFGLTTGRPQA